MAENDRERIDTGHVGIRTPHMSRLKTCPVVSTNEKTSRVLWSQVEFGHDVHNDAFKNITKNDQKLFNKGVVRKLNLLYMYTGPVDHIRNNFV